MKAPSKVKRHRTGMQELACLVVCVIAGGLISGCGSSASKSSNRIPSTSKSLVQTKVSYIGQIDEICKHGNAEEAPIAKEAERIIHEHLGAAKEAEDLAPVFERAASLDRRFNARVRAVPEPSGEAAILGKIAAGHEDEAVGAERRANLLRHYDAATFEVATKEIEEEQARLFALEQGYGFKVCGSEHQTSKHTDTSPSTANTTGSEPKHLKIGQSAAVGNLSIRPTSFVKLGGGGEAVKWRVTISVKNDGDSGAQPFCGDGAGSLVDNAGRTYEAESVVNEANSVNCGEKVQPGLTAAPFVIDFKTPADANPVTLSLWGEGEYQEQAQSWTVH
jgi:hypothetical protein